METLLLTLLLGLLLTLGLSEYLMHRRTLASIPIRIHVNGTRGKSSVTRLLYGAIRNSGKVVCAKTTGTLARFITPQGREYPIYRPAGANIGEQIRIARMAAAYKPDVLVIECMALQPSYQWMSEAQLVRGTHGVITNARADHLDVMGPDTSDVALALAGMTPRKGKLYTAERKLDHIFQYTARDRGSEFIGVTEEDVEAVTEEDLRPFSYHEHAENVALVLKVCEDLGIDRSTALKGMYEAPLDSGVLKTFPLKFFGRDILFVNAFAANDPESTGGIWEAACQRHGEVEKRRLIALFNCRSDRPDRSFQLGTAAAVWPKADKYVLIGSGAHAWAKPAFKAGIDAESVHFADGKAVADIFEDLVSFSGEKSLIVGMGNIGGPGMELIKHIRNRCAPGMEAVF
jgi:poly-gamma-glutamate synthase PgsB/CapB